MESELQDCIVEMRSWIEKFTEMYTAPIDFSCLRTVARNWEERPCEEHGPPDAGVCALAEFNDVGEPCALQSTTDVFVDPRHCDSGLFCDGETCVVARTVPEGGSCSENLECTDLLRCIGERCTAEEIGLGGACLSHSHCEFFLFCNDGFCAAALGQFEQCEETEACGMPFWCIDGTCDLLDDRICLQNIR